MHFFLTMSFKNMMSGDDSCGGSNPMAQMMKQFGQDRSLQRVSALSYKHEKKET
ncbi:uncharacterized protein B0P05DRAFT_530976 [Gilbertella persicaria]|uniref:uncharacterized protein n=1 Tax=Gilbertella persicaria TaxID=101096 RepID=UPI00221FF842|nr:uncharacterized protein B0P05DRAFT_530976 [Gilbertella persicaria]KAI8087981.1 hypothetical protein B0P05DRAFT_530976 [Gilbertella persicaria]